jgi:hypothetical protein
MGRSPFRAIGRVLFWRYQRGSWQYDILCGLILLFIFLTPKSIFDGTYFAQDESPVSEVQSVKIVEAVDSPTDSFEEESEESQDSVH